MRCQMCNIWGTPTRKSDEMFSARFDYKGIADAAKERYNAESYYNEIMKIYGSNS